MKKLSLIILLAMSTLFAMAQTSRIDLRSESKAECVNSDMTSLKASFSFASIEAEDCTTERGVFSWISLPNTVLGGNEGDPQVPVVNELIAIPMGANPRIEITSYSSTDYRLEDYGMHTLVPRQPSLRKDQNPDEVPFVYNASAYQTRGLASAPRASVNVDGIMRGIQVGKMCIEPVSYDPVNNTMRVFNDIKVVVHFDGADAQATEDMLVSTYSPYFDVIYAQMFNGRAVLDVYSDHPDLYTTPVKMIVITTSTYANNTAFQNWVTWKKQKGIYTTVYTTSETGTSASAIKTFIRNKYNTDAPTFVVIVGDKADVAGSQTGSASYKITDLYYSSTTDSDLYPEMFLSRMPVSSTSELTNLINKIMTYEQYTMSNPSYLDETLLIAGWDSSWTSRVGKPTIQYANTYYFNSSNGITPRVFLTTGSGQTTCYNYINQVGFVNYTAHGSETSWADPSFSVSDVSSMTNNDKYLWAMGNCCLAADWGYSGTCFAEAMLRAANKGAFGYIGSCPSSYWYEDYYFGVGATSVMSQMPTQAQTSTGCYDAMFDDTGFNTLNSVPFIGNLAVAYAHAGSYSYSVSDKYYWEAYHCLGDGSVMPYHKNPDANVVSHDPTFPAGATSFAVSAVPGSYVAITQDNEIIGVAVVPSSGTVNVPVTPVNTGEVMVVVTRQQRQPYITTLQVASQASEYTITVSASPTNGGTVSGAGTFPTGSTRTVTATANTGYTFVNWTENGNVVSTNASYSFTLNYNRNLIANFAVQTFTITATSNPAIGGSVRVSGNRDTFNYGFEDGTLQGWTVRSNDNNSTTWAIGQNGYNPTGSSGTVYSTHNGNYYVGSVYDESNAVDDWLISPQFMLGGSMSFYIKITNTSYTDYYSVLLSTGGNSISNFTTTLVSTTQVTSTNYVLVSVDLSNYSGQGYVAIRHTAVADQASLLVDDITLVEGEDPSNASGTFNYGASCTVTATPNSGYHFVNWTENGTVVSSSASYTFTVNSNRDLVANFSEELSTYTVSVSANPTNGGNVSGGGSFTEGQSCTVTATPNTNYTFANWTENGTVVSTNASYTFNVTGNRSLVANFTYVPPTYTVNVSANPTNGGNVSGGGSFTEGQSCTVTATPNTNYTFANWTENGTVVSSNASYTFNVTGNRNLVANFTYVPPTYTINVTANPAIGGNVSGGGSFTEGESCTVTATPATGYSFANWTENGTVVSSNASYTFTVNANRNLVANFTINTYTINVTANPAIGGNVSGGGTFNYGESCTVTATPATGYSFTNWTENGTVVSSSANYTFTVNANRNLVANFSINTYTINVTANPAIGGNVSGGGSFNYGESCTVTATPATGYSFTNWTENGTVVSSSANYTFTVNANRNLVANFAADPVPTYTISVSANPTNGGSVSGGGTFEQGESCTVSATAYNGYTFNNWTENGTVVSSNASYTFTVNANRNLVANFTANPVPTYTVSVSANPANGGSVSGGGTFEQGESCTVNATANNGYTFNNWTENGSVVSSNASYTFTVNANRNLVANFTANPVPTYTISVSASPANGGNVSGGGTFEQGESCTVIATANGGYTFESWTENGTVVSSNASYTFTVNANRDLVANFTANPVPTYTISVSASPANGGNVSGGGTFEQGESCTVIATANSGYTFESWTENGTVVSSNASYTFTVNANRDLVAIFSADPVETYTITATVDPVDGGTVIGAGTYEYGAQATLKVIPNENYTFMNWSEFNGIVVSEELEYSFTVTGNRDLVATLLFFDGMGEQANINITLFPNPASNKLTVEASEAIDHIEIFNTVGAMVFSQKNCTDKVEIHTADLQAGTYLIRLTTQNATEVRKFVKK